MTTLHLDSCVLYRRSHGQKEEKKVAIVQISSDGLIAKEDKSDVWYRQKSVRGEFLFPLFSNCLGYALAPVPLVGKGRRRIGPQSLRSAPRGHSVCSLLSYGSNEARQQRWRHSRRCRLHQSAAARDRRAEDPLAGKETGTARTRGRSVHASLEAEGRRRVADRRVARAHALAGLGILQKLQRHPVTIP